MVAIPDFDAGAMENWGLITYREMLLLYTPLASTAKVRQTIAEVVAHELAHQWFGNLVTMRWWDDLWLNEGFASYMQYAGADHAADGAFHLMEQFPIRSLQQAMEPDELESSHALQVPEAQSPADIFTIFDQITYDKGASMVRMMQYLIGEEVLRKGLMQYLKSNVYDVTTMHNLWEILFTLNEEQPTANVTLGWDKKPVNIEQLMYCWITGPGFPLVTIDRNYDNATATISQKRFYITDKATSRSTGECAGQWYVPLWQRNKTATWGPSWLEPNSVLLLELNGTGSDDWLIVNPKARAYFRTLYDDRNWDLITEQLLKDHTVYDVETRSQLIDDAFALARAGELHYSKALALSQYLRMETHFVPWETGIKVLNHLGKMYDEHEMYGTFKQYFLELIVPLFERTSNDAKLRADDILQERLRSTSWRFACHLDHAGCVDRARALYGQYMQECSGPGQRSGSECNP
uniref:glutamyl aminopeptidase n=1 Tax=Plectus sambesii TaxID=2011161 RepID=A0A914WWA9_9BILA